MSVYIMAALYILAGLWHFVRPKFYLYIMPPYLPAHQALVFWSGVAEVLLGVGLLFPATRVWAAWGLIALLIAIFSANYYMAVGEKFQHISPWDSLGQVTASGPAHLVGESVYKVVWGVSGKVLNLEDVGCLKGLFTG